MEQQLVKENISVEEFIATLSDDELNGDFEEIYKRAPQTEDTMCGMGAFRGRRLQGFANKKAFVFILGVVGLIFASTHSYYNGTITTIEKRFKIPSRNIGIIATGNDITSLLLSTFIAYYVAKGHRPRWLALSIVIVALYCFINSAPHFIFGPGEEALSLTEEFGGVRNIHHSTALQEIKDKRLLCRTNATSDDASCRKSDEGDFFAQVFFFVAQLVAGVGQSLKHTLGISYLDDNIKKSKAPALMSISYFIRLLGPAMGYNIASISLGIYVAPGLTPTITNKDPRWIGAWHLGWIILGTVLIFFVPVMAMFPKQLPRAAVRNAIEGEKKKRLKATTFEMCATTEKKGDNGMSVDGLLLTFKRLLTNKVFMLNNIAGIFYIFGGQPFWTYTPKLLETLYHTTASNSTFLVGSIGFTASALGILTAGIVITKFKPRARVLTLWNVFIGLATACCIFSFALLGCTQNDNSVKVNFDATCNADCHCDFVRYSPVCGTDGLTYTSACHAGCNAVTTRNSSKLFTSCSCISSELENSATSGPCTVNCDFMLTIFLAVTSLMKFLGASGRASNFLVGIRCIEKEDKAVALGFGMALVRLFASVPSPIFFGYILDSACLVFGKTCSRRGNCWLYDGEYLRYSFNFIAGASILIGACLDLSVWHFSGDLKIFDDEEDEKDTVKAKENQN